MKEKNRHLSPMTALLRRRALDRPLIVCIQNLACPARAAKVDGVLGDRPINAANQVIIRWIVCATGNEQAQSGGKEKRAMHAPYSPPDNVPASNGKIVSSGLKSEVTRLDLSPATWHMGTVEFRARLFWQSLSPTRRAEIARRGFCNQPIRRSDQPDPEAELP